MLMQHRQAILGRHMRFDDLLKYINDLSGSVQAIDLLLDADALYCASVGNLQPAGVAAGAASGST
jgi:hypothetical protein